MSDKQKDMISVRTLDLNAISIVEKDEPAGLVTVDISGHMSFEAEIEKVIAEAKKYQIHRFHDASYGAMLPAENCIRAGQMNMNFCISRCRILCRKADCISRPEANI